MNLEALLPAELRGPATTITPLGGGFSDARVFRVVAGDRTFVLKIADTAEPVAAWRARLRLHELAAAAGIAPAVVHVDEARRAVVSAFVVDRGFFAYYMTPATHRAAIVQLGTTVRRVHALTPPAGTGGSDPRARLAAAWAELADGFAVPAFVGEAIHRVLAEPVPESGRAPVLSHNDLNPGNLAYDGERLWLLDWDAAGESDPFYDLAALAVFLRMDDAACGALLAAYDGEPAGAPVTALPARFAYDRRLVAALCGTLFLAMARRAGHRGAAGGETLAATPAMVDVVQRFRAGTLSPASADGQWAFGLALVKASAMA